ncbi:MAG: energy-coupling factor transporter transmembrane component T [Chloroflexota bacterium]|nr:energy-coupling factor transporter transmembrane component T [Chloroflexota bacterium]
MIHPGAWLAWLVAAIVALSVTRNPAYLFFILGAIAITVAVLRPHSKAPPLPMSLWRFGLIIVVFSALFNAFTSHFGATVLFSLPESWPLIGGEITLEGLVFGVLNGLVLAGFLAAFTVLNLALPVHSLVRMIPRAFYPVAVVISIAVAFVPNTLAQFQAVREAQTMRGHRVRGLRDWLPLFMPVLIGGLERAMQLSEAMTARGFGGTGLDSRSDQNRRGLLPVRLSLLTGLFCVLAGLALRLFGVSMSGTLLLLAGSALLILALWMQGRGVRRTVYRPARWVLHDWFVLVGAALVAVVYLFPLPGLDRSSLHYSPYPLLSWPDLNSWIVLATAGLLVPASILARASFRRDPLRPDGASA